MDAKLQAQIPALIMSLDTTIDIWNTLAGEHYPTLTEEQLSGLSMKAASLWYLGANSEEDKLLVELFDQYVMLKTIKGM